MCSWPFTLTETESWLMREYRTRMSEMFYHHVISIGVLLTSHTCCTSLLQKAVFLLSQISQDQLLSWISNRSGCDHIWAGTTWCERGLNFSFSLFIISVHWNKFVLPFSFARLTFFLLGIKVCIVCFLVRYGTSLHRFQIHLLSVVRNRLANLNSALKSLNSETVNPITLLATEIRLS